MSTEEMHVNRHGNMIILLYLTIIIAWALLVLVIKCRKAREKRMALAQQEARSQNAVHVIQIGNTFYDVIPVRESSTVHNRCHCRAEYNTRQSCSTQSLNTNSHTNPSFVNDEGVFPASSFPNTNDEPPPPYELIFPNRHPKPNPSISTVPNAHVENAQSEHRIEAISNDSSTTQRNVESTEQANHQQRI